MREERVESVERALSILEAFGSERRAMSLARLAEETGLPKPTILRLSASLIRFGHLRRDADGTFRLGPSLWRLGTLYRRTFGMGDAVRPVLRALVAETGESASYYVREGDERICLYRELSPRGGGQRLDEGQRLTLGRGASSWVLLSWADPRARDGLERVRVSRGERNPGLVAVATPVLAEDDRLLGALTLSGPRERMDEAAQARAAALLPEAAARIRIG
ncbi:IclR family transcriptional regulator [Salinarimonas chemoclinalis]|uniref:IclR family transcriptional regulator n=1 Tax=Salinarimonas chemoclinalis TaxID=3241599 RepID=UPI0035568A0F